MNLAICTVGELFGGVERHILGMSTWLKREGHDFLLVLFHDKELARQAREIGVEPHILETRGRFDIGAPGRLAWILEKHRIDVVHAHGYRAVVNCALAQRKHKFAMVRTVHGLVESSGRLSWRGIKGDFYTWLERSFGRRAKTAIVYVTEDLCQRHQRYDHGLFTRTIYNGIDPLNREDYPRPMDLERGFFHLAAIGRVTRIKGLEFAIRAMSRLDPDLRIVLNIIGTGSLTMELRTLAEELSVGNQVRFLGFKENVYDFLAHIDALILPSIHEGLPYTILESMSLGVPIIASKVGGVSEILEDGVTGSLVPVRGVEDICSAIVKSVENKENRVAIARRAKKHQEQRFSLNIMGSSYKELYFSLGEI